MFNKMMENLEKTESELEKNAAVTEHTAGNLL